jgi:hypothetical protein
MLKATAALVAFGVAIAAAAPGARADLITNGSFSSTSNGGGELGFNTAVTGWSSTGYNFLFTSGSASTTGVTGQFGNVQLWGPGNGSMNGMPASSPDGGNYVGMDGAYDAGPLSQTIGGLTVGDTYAVSFYWAGAQQEGFDGLNTEQLKVSLGGQTQSTAVYDNTSPGFSGWMSQTYDFTATSASELLSFLAVGTPITPSVPPFALLDGVSMTQVPEPASLALLGMGALGVGGLVRRRRARQAAEAAHAG